MGNLKSIILIAVIAAALALSGCGESDPEPAEDTALEETAPAEPATDPAATD